MLGESLDMTTPQRIHIVGIGGAGMSAMAQLLAEMGHEVSGSDLRDSPALERLRRAGVVAHAGHRASNLGEVDLVTASPAVPSSNPELVAARDRSLAVATRPMMLGALARVRRTLAVAGTHGKTTTSSMLALILLEAGLEPSFLLGADVAGIGAGAVWGAGEWLVVEADESYGAFSLMEPDRVVLTNVEPDHLDHYGTLEDLEQAFAGLVERSKNRSVVMADDPGARRVGEQGRAVLVGSDGVVAVRVEDIELERASSTFTMQLEDGERLRLQVAAPGRHNVANAAVAAAAAASIGVDSSAIAAGLRRFAGVPRRFEFRGEVEGVSFVDDYAHLPAEVEATIQAALAGGYERVVAVFQPHRYTRTQAVATGFASSFRGADLVVVTDIYGAGEEPIPGVTGRLVAESVAATSSVDRVRYVQDLDQLAPIVAALLEPGDLCLTMGAGDLTLVPDEIQAMLGR